MRDLSLDEIDSLENDNLKPSPDFKNAIHDKYISDLSKASFKINDIVDFIIYNFPGAKEELDINNNANKITNKSTILALKKRIRHFLQKSSYVSKKEHSNQLNYVINAQQLKSLYNNLDFQKYLKNLFGADSLDKFRLNEFAQQNTFVANKLKDVITETEDKEALQQKIFESKKRKVIELLFDKYFDFDKVKFFNAYKKDPKVDINNFIHAKKS